MVISFVTWAMDRFDSQTFALCGVIHQTLRQGMVRKLVYEALGSYFHIQENKAGNFLEVQGARHQPVFSSVVKTNAPPPSFRVDPGRRAL